MMKKAIVIGCPGSGKTTFSEKLRRKTGLPLFYLDAIWHKPDRTHISRPEFDRRLAEIGQLDSWIIDGNYSRTIETRLQMCDTVFFFDLSTQDCLQGATERLGKGRYDVPWIDTVLDPHLRAEIEEFPEKNRPVIYELLEQYRDGREIVIFSTREQADSYLQNLSNQEDTVMWQRLYQAARNVQNDRAISPFVEAGGVAAAVLSSQGNIYVGVCIDTACSLGMCAERNAIANMITHGESRIHKVVAVMPDGKVGPPCGVCREFMMQLDPDSGDIEILLDLDTLKTVKLRDLVPDWWGKEAFSQGSNG